MVHFDQVDLCVCERQSSVVVLVLMLVIAVLVMFVLLFSATLIQQVQHLPYDGLKGSAQFLAAVGFS